MQEEGQAERGTSCTRSQLVSGRREGSVAFPGPCTPCAGARNWDAGTCSQPSAGVPLAYVLETAVTKQMPHGITWGPVDAQEGIHFLARIQGACDVREYES